MRWLPAFVFAVTLLLVQAAGERFARQSPCGRELGPREEEALSLLSVSLASEEPGEVTDAQVTVHRVRLAAGGGQEYRPVQTASVSSSSPARLTLTEGSYLVVVRARGFARMHRFVDLDGDTSLRLVLTPARATTVHVVVDREGQRRPLMGATVLLSDEGRLPWGDVTNAAGKAIFDDVPSAPLLLRIFAPGFQPYRAYIEGDLLVKLEPSSVTVIRVLDEGEPAIGAEVILSGAQLWPARSVATDDRGQAEVTGLAAGTYSVYAKKGARVSEVESELVIRNEPGRDVMTLELLSGRFLTVTTRSAASGDPIAGARVSWATSGLGQFVLYGRTDSKGQVQLGPVLHRSGLIQARAPGFVSRTASLDSGEATEPKDAPGDEVVVELLAAGRITGRVVDDRGFPIAGAVVEAVGIDQDGIPFSVTTSSDAVADAHFDWARAWQSSPQRRLIPAGELGVMVGPVPPIPLADAPSDSPRQTRLTTDERGYFAIEEVPPGDGVVLARHPDYLGGKSSEFRLSPGGRVEKRIVLGGGLPLSGRVVDHAGFPVAAARISAMSREFEGQVLTDTDGSFEIPAAPRELSLRVFDPDNPLRVLLAREVKSSEREERQLIALPAPRSDSRILVLDAKGEPLQLAQVTLTSLSPSQPFKRTRFTSDEGVAEFEQVAGLDCRLSVSKVGYVEKQTEQSMREEIRVQLDDSLEVRVLLTGVRGRHRASGASVRLVTGSKEVRGIADELGWVTLHDVPAGRATLFGEHPDYGRASAAVLVEAQTNGRPVELPALDLRPTTAIRGQVVDPSGQPIPRAWVSTARVGVFLAQLAPSERLVRSGDDGRFEIEVEPEKESFLYAAQPSVAFGFSDAFDSTSAVTDLRVLVDHTDRAPSHLPATVLATIEERGGRFVVYDVALRSAADEAGLRVGDAVVEVDGRSPSSIEELRDWLSGSVGSEVRLVIRRESREHTYLITREPFLRGR